MKSVEIHKAINGADVANQAAQVIFDEVSSAQRSNKNINIALTGGTVGILTLKHFAERADLHQLDFTGVHFYFGDERYVAKDSDDRNAKQARAALLDHIEIPASNIHEFPSTDSGLSIDEAAIDFQTQLLAELGENPKMDLMLLGMGPDGHIASLFPGKDHSEALIVAEHDSPKPPAERLSMSLELINRSTRIAFVVSGIDKAEAIEKIHKSENCQLPAAQVSAVGQTLWIIDEAAGAAFWSC